MAHTRKRVFDGLYAQLEETDGHVVLFSAGGNPSVIFGMTNPVQQLCTDAEQYLRFQDVLSNVAQTLGEGYALQKRTDEERAAKCKAVEAKTHDFGWALSKLRCGWPGVHGDTHLPYCHAGGAARPVRAVRPEEMAGLPRQGQ